MNPLVLIFALAAIGGGIALYFTHKSSSSRSTPTVVASSATYAPLGQWALAYGSAVLSSNNPPWFQIGPTTSPHYLIQGTGPLAAGKTVKAAFSLIGNATLKAAEGGGTAACRLFFQRKGDNLSAVGDLASYRWWSTAKVDLTSPKTFTISAALTPDLWTNVYGKSGTDNSALFAAALADAGNIGMTFGGTGAGAGHGIISDATVTFTLTNFSYS